ncbi:MAG: phosphate ABC transporter permease subunit PstC [Planctomycetes bacterium]|nr:phosphate ABC transporter permease subunit PstC [Planctomycetota bacterium]
MSPSAKDRLLLGVLRGCAALAGLLVVVIAAFLILESVPAFRNVGWTRFFSDPAWHPAPRAEAGQFQMLPMLAGTLAVMAGAVLLATPLGVLSAVFCRYYAPPALGNAYRRLIELLSGIPSVVYGFWGLVTLVPLINQVRPPGASLLAGVLVVAIMILPTVALMADGALAQVPQEYLRAAAALGLSRWTTVRAVVLPAAKYGLFTGVMLETGRAIGETMATLMVCGNIVRFPQSVFDPVRTLTANIALEMAYALGDHRSALFASGLLLLVLIVMLAGAAEWIGGEPARD